MWFVHRDVKRPRESFASHPSMFLLRFTEFQEKVTTVTICQKEGELSTTFQVLHAHKKRVSQLKRDANYLHMQRQTRVRMMMMAAATDAPTATAST